MNRSDVTIIGGGIVGLATARALLQQRPALRVVIAEKEARVGVHQSTHNSGVLHAGLHYAPGSQKAILARQGIRALTQYCAEHGIAHDICGKLVVATSTDQIARLKALQERGEKNGLLGLRWLEPAAAREIEPHVNCVAALHVPEEGIVDYRGVCDALERDVIALGGTVLTGAQVSGLTASGSEWVVQTSANELTARFIVNCAGLHVDRIARLAGERPDSIIVPFRGEYFKLRADRQKLVRNLIYPVPDPAFPFLGVHFTRLIHGGIEAGPNAVLAAAREGYRKTDINPRDLADTFTFAGFWRFLANYPRAAVSELHRSLSKRAFVSGLKQLVPEIEERDLVPGGAGVRAQAMSPQGQLVHDFVFIERANALHVLNAPSPAATASLAIGAVIAQRVLP